jgi:CheY-like chemotaxis protein
MIQSNPPKSMPCVAEPGPLAESPADALASSRQYGILVVDDEASLREMLYIGLEQEGFAVWLAANGREAFEVYRCQRAAIDVVVLDIQMPELNGPQTLAGLQNLSPQIRCCFLSADFESYTEDKLRSLGAAAVLRKPIALHEFAHVLRQLASTADLTSSSR